MAVFDHNVTYNEHGNLITSLSRYAASRQSEVIIIAPHFDDIITNIIGTTINTFIQKNQVPNIMMVQVPLSIDIHRQYLSDVVLLTNAQVFDYGKVRAFNVMVHNATSEEKIEDALLQVDDYKFESPTDLIEKCIGVANYLIIADKYIVIKEYDTIVNTSVYNATMNEVRDAYLAAKERANKNTTMLTKEYMDAYQRYTKLSGNLGIIKVGGGSELEKHCLKDSVDDAVLACRSAYDNGYIRGLNLATISAIDTIRQESDESVHGIYSSIKSIMRTDILDMLFSVFREMSLQVLRNKYSDDVSRHVTLPHEKDAEMRNEDIIDYCIGYGYSYNLVTERVELDENATVINSVSIDIEILNSMISILSTMLTSNQLLTLSRVYDRKMSRKQALQNKMDDQAAMATVITKSVIAELCNNDNMYLNFMRMPVSNDHVKIGFIRRALKKIFKL
jgi:hypothetical protein